MTSQYRIVGETVVFEENVNIALTPLVFDNSFPPFGADFTTNSTAHASTTIIRIDELDANTFTDLSSKINVFVGLNFFLRVYEGVNGSGVPLDAAKYVTYYVNSISSISGNYYEMSVRYVTKTASASANWSESPTYGFTFPDKTYAGINAVNAVVNNYKTESLSPEVGHDFAYTSIGYIPPGSGTNIIDRFPFANDQSSTDVGDLTQARYGMSGQSSTTHGYSSGGFAFLNTIDRIPFAAKVNSSDVGDLSQARYNSCGQSSNEDGYAAGGAVSPTGAAPFVNTIDKFPFSSNANATDVGDLTKAQRGIAGQSSTTHGYSSGGGGPVAVNIIDRFPFASSGNATDVGDLLAANWIVSGQSSTTHGYTSGGFPNNNTIQKFPFAANSNATDVGDLTLARSAGADHSSPTHGYTSGGYRGPPATFHNVIDRFSFATDSNATSVGDLTVSSFYGAGQQD